MNFEKNNFIHNVGIKSQKEKTDCNLLVFIKKLHIVTPPARGIPPTGEIKITHPVGDAANAHNEGWKETLC